MELNKSFEYLTQEVSDIYQKPYLKTAIKSHLNREFEKTHSKKQISDFVDQKFKNYGKTY